MKFSVLLALTAVHAINRKDAKPIGEQLVENVEQFLEEDKGETIEKIRSFIEMGHETFKLNLKETVGQLKEKWEVMTKDAAKHMKQVNLKSMKIMMDGGKEFDWFADKD